ncbi:MAG: helix-turn-helix domain-containing protein, partial [Spirochaetaceae bacterium]|nr:helix-turn-helix domain-containing protein [Spirochaetaceae bacterium]
MSNPVSADSAFLTAAEAAATLGVKPQTLYAYVSRGLIRSEQAGGGRRRRYLRADVLRLRRRVEVRSNPAAAAHHAFTRSEGSILDSSLTLITEEELYYRGLPATALARTATFEQVTALLWSGDLDAPAAAPDASPPAVPAAWLRSDGRLLEPWFAFQSVLPRLAATDPAAEDLRPAAVRRTGARILRAELACVAGGSDLVESAPPSTGRAAQALAAAWNAGDRERAAALIEPALILLADHELNVSTLAARVAASGRASPYHAVLAGLAAVHGTLHGQASTLVTGLLRAVGRPERARGVVEEYLRSRRPL